MKVENDKKIRNRGSYKHRTLRYGMLTLAILMAAVIAVQMVPGGTEDSSADDISIVLNTNTGSGAGYSWSGNTLTITGYNHEYTITQNGTSVLERNIIIKDSGSSSTVTVIIKNINIRGDITLEDNASVNLLLEGVNKISGSIFVVNGYTTKPSLKIDSLTNGSLDVTATGNNAGIGNGGAYGCGTITIAGGTVTATGSNGGAGIGGIGRGSGSGSADYGGNGGTITISGGTVTATGGSGGAGIGGGSASGAYGGGGGTITISGGIVTAKGGSNGAGIGGGGGGTGGQGGSGGTIMISGGTVTATGTIAAGIGGGSGGGGSHFGAAALLTIKSEASVTVFSSGGLPAIHINTIKTESTGFFVNAVLDSNLPSTSTELRVYADGNTTPLITLTPPGADYSNFAFMLPGSSSSKNYNISVMDSAGSRPLLRSSDDSPVIYSIITMIGYDAHNSVKNKAFLPSVLGDLVSGFTAVTDISDVPDEALVGAPLFLGGTVSPSDATYQNITWSVVDDGDTGAAIEGGALTASGEGTVTVSATITSGTAPGTSFTKGFTITVKAAGGGGGGGGGGDDPGSNSMLMLVVIAVVVVAILAAALFFMHKRGKTKGV